ncbi:MAG TPA: DinB family protein, partial [Aggregatilineales bacterium]|nr:DinB family protein [Aggregatilineales bacterium]
MENVLIWVTPILTTTPKRWTNLIDTLPADLLAQPPAPGEWSALECLIHILDTERNVFAVRLKNFLAGQDLSAFD